MSHSILEVCVKNAIGYAINFTAQLVLFRDAGFTMAHHFGISLVFVVLAFAKGLAVRRLFNYVNERRIRRMSE